MLLFKYPPDLGLLLTSHEPDKVSRAERRLVKKSYRLKRGRRRLVKSSLHPTITIFFSTNQRLPDAVFFSHQ